MDCVLNDYLRGMKGYGLFGVKPGGSKFINPKCITFNEFLQEKKSKNPRMNILKTMIEKTQFEVKVPTMDTNSSETTIIEATHYNSTRDKIKRKIVPSQRDDYADLGCYDLNVAEGLQNS